MPTGGSMFTFRRLSGFERLALLIALALFAYLEFVRWVWAGLHPGQWQREILCVMVLVLAGIQARRKK